MCVQENISEMLPLVYTPTIGDACLNWGTLIPRPTGLYVSATDAGQVDALLANWPQQQVGAVPAHRLHRVAYKRLAETQEDCCKHAKCTEMLLLSD
jgi:hypothetical protein